jgi:hypothetical protein
LGKFADLTSAERLLILQIFVMLVGVRLALWWLPFKRLQAFLASVATNGSRSRKARVIPARRMAGFVVAAGRYVPGASCLTQALVAVTVLRRAGHAAVLRLGVGRDAKNDFHAHAWVECDAEVVIGQIETFSSYSPLPSLERPGIRA